MEIVSFCWLHFLPSKQVLLVTELLPPSSLAVESKRIEVGTWQVRKQPVYVGNHIMHSAVILLKDICNLSILPLYLYPVHFTGKIANVQMNREDSIMNIHILTA